MSFENELKQTLDQGLSEIKQHQNDLQKNFEQLDGVIKKIEADTKSNGEANVETKENYQQSVEKIASIEKTIDDLIESTEKLKGGTPQSKTVGDIVVEQCKDVRYSGGNMTLAEIDAPLFGKSVTSAAASAGGLVEPDRVGMVAPKEMPLTIRDLLTSVSTSSNSVEYLRENVFTNNAAPQAGEGATKAESDITFEKQTVPVQTLAHWVGASRQILSDANGLRSLIDNKLRYGLKFVEDQQLLLGDGTGNNLNGLVPNATAYDASLNASGDTFIDQLRKAIYQAGLSYLPVTGIVLNPQDWMQIELHKTTENGYLFSNPANQTETRLWGRRVVPSYQMTAGSFLAGSFAMGATLYDREQVTVRVAEQHANFFIQNMVAILLEERLALAVERPDAFVTGTLTATP